MADFDLLFGNNKSKRHLASAIRKNTLPHALLIVGPKGSGKHTLALEIMRGMLCEGKERGRGNLPCAVCNTCRRVLEGQHTDIKHLTRQSGKATIGVEEVRLIREDMFLSAGESDYKFYVIEEADLLTNGAQNALLKVLEEPPNAVHIILLAASQDKILTTIKSRAQLIKTELFRENDMLRYFDERYPGGKAAREELLPAVKFSGGIIGRAISNLEPSIQSEKKETRELISSFVGSLSSRVEFSGMYSIIMNFPKGREELRSLLEGILGALRDIIVAKNTDEGEMLFYPSKEQAEQALSAMSTKRLIDITDILLASLRDIDKNVNTSSLLTDIAARIKSV